MTAFLTVLVHLTLAVASVLLVLGVIRFRRRGSGGAVLDVMEAAFLGGGPGRVADTAIAAMHADGRITVGGPGIVVVLRPVFLDPVERALLTEHAAAANGALRTLRSALMRSPAVQEVGDALAARGLLVTPAEAGTWRRWGTVQGILCLVGLPVAFAVALGASFAGRGDGALRAFSLLPSLFVGCVTGLVCASLAGKRITGAGLRAHRSFREGLPPLASAGQLVAAQGVRGLPDTFLGRQLRTASRQAPTARSHASSQDSFATAVVWCASSGSGCGGSSCGSGGHDGGGSSGSSCGSSGGSCGSSSSCGSSGSSCGGGSGCGGGS